MFHPGTETRIFLANKDDTLAADAHAPCQYNEYLVSTVDTDALML